VKIPLARGGTCYAVTFEIIVEGFDTAKTATLGELELGIFAKAGRIRVEKSASVSERFQNELGSWNLVSELGTLLAGIADTQFEKGLDGQPTTL